VSNPWAEILEQFPKKNWFAWQDLLDHCQLMDFEILGWFQKGLQPCSKPGIPIHCPLEHHAFKHLLYLQERMDWHPLRRAKPRVASLEYCLGVFNTWLSTLFATKLVEPVWMADDKSTFVDYLIDCGLHRYHDSDGFLISSEEIQLLKKMITNLDEEYERIDSEIASIVSDEPTLDGPWTEDNWPSKGLKWKYLAIPRSDEDVQKLIREAGLEESIFSREHPIQLLQEADPSHPPPASTSSIVPACDSGSEIPVFYFFRQGDNWTIEEESTDLGTLNHLDGFFYVRELLKAFEEAGGAVKRVSYRELYNRLHPETPGTGTSVTQQDELEASFGPHQRTEQQDFDDEKVRAKLALRSSAELKKMAQQLERKLPLTELQEDRDELRSQLTMVQDVLYAKNPGDETQQVENLRSTVYHAIHYALTRLHDKRPSLKPYLTLKETIRTSEGFWVYVPAPERPKPEWVLEPV